MKVFFTLFPELALGLAITSLTGLVPFLLRRLLLKEEEQNGKQRREKQVIILTDNRLDI